MRNKLLGATMGVALSIAGWSQSASALVLSHHDLAPAPMATSVALTSAASGVTASALTLVNAASTLAPFSNHFYHNGWDTTLNLAKYYELTLSSTTAYQLGTAEFSMEEAGGSPGGFSMRSSADGFTADLGTGSFINGLVTAFSVDISSLGALSAPLTFRWYVTASSSAARAGFANHELGGTGGGLSDVGIDLFITSVPEPGTLALFGLGLAGLGFARRKRMI